MIVRDHTLVMMDCSNIEYSLSNVSLVKLIGIGIKGFTSFSSFLNPNLVPHSACANSNPSYILIMVHSPSIMSTFLSNTDVWELDVITNDDIPFVVPVNLMKIIAVGMETGLFYGFVSQNNSRMSLILSI